MRRCKLEIVMEVQCSCYFLLLAPAQLLGMAVAMTCFGGAGAIAVEDTVEVT